MSLELLKLHVTSEDVYLVRKSIELGKLREELQNDKEPLPVVILISNDQVGMVKRLEGQILDCGEKNPKTELARYFLNKPKDKMLLLDVNFKGTNQIKRSMNDFYKKACEHKENNIFIVFTSEDSFCEMRDYYSHDESNLPTKTSRGDGQDTDEKLIFELLGTEIDITSIHKEYVGNHPKVREIQGYAMLAASQEMPVLVTGETGTGKGLLAREIHKNSSRSNKQFVAVNCGNLHLFESQLFGHVKGAFTGATSDKKGLWEYAEDGTLFLDEIGDLKLEHQVKILDAIESSKIRRLGSTDEIQVNARIIAATNRELRAMVRAGKFRQDLYYRVGGFNIETLGLRYHLSDIPIVAKAIWRNLTDPENKCLTGEVLEDMEKHSWPGNVREMRIVLENMSLFFPGVPLNLGHLDHAFKMAGVMTCNTLDAMGIDDLAIHKLGCFHHLKIIEDMINASLINIDKAFAGDTEDSTKDQEFLLSLRMILTQLGNLTSEEKRLLFFEEDIYNQTIKVESGLSQFTILIQKRRADAEDLYCNHLRKEFEALKSELFKVIGSLVS